MGKLMIGNNEVTPIISNGSGGDINDWGQTLHDDVITDAEYLSAPYKCYNNTSITSFTASNAIKINSLYSTFTNCSSLTSVSFPALIEIGASGAFSCFSGCSSLASVSFPVLEIIGGSSFSSCFYGCSNLVSITFPALTTLGAFAFGSAGMTSYSCFNGCSKLASVSFPALTTRSFGEYTNQFSALFDTNTASVSGECIVHFPSNLESTIQGLTGYPYFIARNGTNTRITLAFDLPATS